MDPATVATGMVEVQNRKGILHPEERLLIYGEPTKTRIVRITNEEYEELLALKSSYSFLGQDTVKRYAWDTSSVKKTRRWVCGMPTGITLIATLIEGPSLILVVMTVFIFFSTLIGGHILTENVSEAILKTSNFLRPRLTIMHRHTIFKSCVPLLPGEEGWENTPVLFLPEKETHLAGAESKA